MKLSISLIAPFLLCSFATALGQTTRLEGQIFDDRNRPASGVRIIAPGGQATVSDNRGHFNIRFPTSVQPGGPTRIIVVKSNWVIYQPMFGKCVTQSAENYEPLKVIIVPKGSPLALSPERLSQVIARWTAERVRLRANVESLKQNNDEYAFLKRYAREYGFTLARFQKAAQEWAQIKDSDSKVERARKEYWLGNLTRVTDLTGQAGPVAVEALKRMHQQHVDEGRVVIDIYKLEGLAFSDQVKFREALISFGTIEDLFEARYLPKEDLIPERAEIKFLMADTKLALGEKLEGEEGLRLLKESVADFQQAMTFYTRSDWPQKWALTQHNSGYALTALGDRTRGSESIKYLNDAVSAYRAALEGFDPVESRLDWSMTQHNLGRALSSLSERVTDWLDGNKLLNEAIAADRAALKTTSRESMSLFWGGTQSNLAGVLSMIGRRLRGPDGVRYLKEAVTAYRAALEVHSGKALAQFWAVEQNALGEVLETLGERIQGREGERYLNEAIAAHQAALKVFTSKSPTMWGLTHRGLARAYFLLNDWSQAAEAYANVLTIDADNHEAYVRVASIYHNKLFQFEKELVLSTQWLERHPEGFMARPHLAEAYFTTGRFRECEQLISTLLSDPLTIFEAELRAIEIAALLANSRASEVPSRVDAMIAELRRHRAQLRIFWDFDGTKHFIHESEKLSAYRVWLDELLDAFAIKDRDARLRALQEVQAKFKSQS